MILYQHELSDGKGSRLICWLEQKLKRGVRLTLVELPDRIWQVEQAYNLQVEKQALYRPWRVGGLV